MSYLYVCEIILVFKLPGWKYRSKQPDLIYIRSIP
jgi:hypothetical protein